MMQFKLIAQKILNCFSKNELKIYDSIHCFDNLQLASMGHNDVEGYQIFTPDFIVKEMCASVGDSIFDFSKNVLEPTSGDGAFTVYILLRRLEKALNNDKFEIESLKAISTIYSIEMDKELIEKQRNNILTVISIFINEHNLKVSDGYIDVFKCIVTKNFIWGMFNSVIDNGGGLAGVDVVYKMPEAESKKYKPLDFPVWDINENSIEFHEEGVDLW